MILVGYSYSLGLIAHHSILIRFVDRLNIKLQPIALPGDIGSHLRISRRLFRGLKFQSQLSTLRSQELPKDLG